MERRLRRRPRCAGERAARVIRPPHACVAERQREGGRRTHAFGMSVYQPPAGHAAAATDTLEWLRNLSATQLADATLAINQVSQELNAVASRVSGEHELRTAGWERRLALAQGEWQRSLGWRYGCGTARHKRIFVSRSPAHLTHAGDARCTSGRAVEASTCALTCTSCNHWNWRRYSRAGTTQWTIGAGPGGVYLEFCTARRWQCMPLSA